MSFGTPWGRRAGPSPLANTGPSSGSTGPMDVYVYVPAAQMSLGSSAILDTPRVRLPAVGHVSWTHHMFGAHIGTLRVYWCRDGSGCVQVWYRAGEQHAVQTAEWTTAYANFVAGGAGFVRFNYSVASNTSAADIAIDTLSVSANFTSIATMTQAQCTFSRRCGCYHLQDASGFTYVVHAPPDTNGHVVLPPGTDAVRLQYVYCTSASWAPTAELRAISSLIGSSTTALGTFLTDAVAPLERSLGTLRTISLNTDGALRIIEPRAFLGATDLTGIHIPASVIEIGQSAFSGCASLASLTFEDPAPRAPVFDLNIGSYAFGAYVAAADDLTATLLLAVLEGRFQYDMFGSRRLTYVMIPERVKSIGDNAFMAAGVSTAAFPLDSSLANGFMYLTVCDHLRDRFNNAMFVNGTQGNCTPLYLRTSSAFSMRVVPTQAAPPTVIDVGETVTLSPPANVPKRDLFVNYATPSHLLDAAEAIRFELRADSLVRGTGGTVSINSTSGMLNVILTTPGNYSLDVNAVDWSGRVATIFTWNYVVQFSPLLRTTIQIPFVGGLPPIIAVGEATRLDTRNFDLTTLYSNAVGNLTLALVSNNASLRAGEALFATPAESVGVSLNKVVVVAFPTTLGRFTIQFEARDDRGVVASEPALVWTFNVTHRDTAIPSFGPNSTGCVNGQAVDSIPFDRQFTCNCSGTVFSGSNCQISAFPQLQLVTNGQQFVRAGEEPSQFTFYNRTKWAWGSTYQIAPFNFSSAFTEVGGARQSRSVTFRLLWDVSPPIGFFIDGGTGEILAKIPTGAFFRASAQLVAESPETLRVEIANLDFNFLPADINAQSSAVGPNGQSCENGGTRTDTIDGESEFDGHYTCTCPSSFNGANCQSSLAASSNPDNVSTSFLIPIMIVVGLLIGALTLSQYRAYVVRHTPIDMEALQEKLREEMGLGGAVFDIGKGEVGLALSFTKAVDCDDVESSCLRLLKVLQDASGLPTQLTRLLRQDETKIIFNESGTQDMAVLRMRPPHTLKEGSLEQFSTALDKVVKRARIYFAADVFVETISVAVPKCVPRTLDRRSVCVAHTKK